MRIRQHREPADALNGARLVPPYRPALAWRREGSDVDHELAGVGLAQPGLPRPPRGWRR